MSDINAIVRASGASRRQVDSWTRNHLLCANLDHGRYEYPPEEADVARALYRMSEAGIAVSSDLAKEVIAKIRSGKLGRLEFTDTRLDFLSVAVGRLTIT